MIELPPTIGGPSAWYGPDIADSAVWIEPLAPPELDEIESAAKLLEQKEVGWQSSDRHDFPLPNLCGRLAKIGSEVLEGRGFAPCAACRSSDGAGAWPRSPFWDLACTGEGCGRKTARDTCSVM